MRAILLLLLLPVVVSAGSLKTQVLSQGLGALAAHDANGLGAEAARVLKDDSLEYSKELGAALENLDQYFGMTAETVARPVEFSELEQALTSPGGVAVIRDLFDAMIDARFEVSGEILVPEIGGEATLDGTPTFHRVLDPVRPMFEKLVAAMDDPEALSALYKEHKTELDLIDEHGLLSGFLSRLPRYKAKKLPEEKLRKIQRLTVTTILQNSADTYVMEPKAQLEGIINHGWSGRYLGWWHTHPPNYRAGGWVGGGIPSGNDMDIAGRSGQNLTIVFQPDGFTVFDLSPLANNPAGGFNALRKIVHRSERWRRHFAARHAEIGATAFRVPKVPS